MLHLLHTTSSKILAVYVRHADPSICHPGRWLLKTILACCVLKEKPSCCIGRANHQQGLLTYQVVPDLHKEEGHVAKAHVQGNDA